MSVETYSGVAREVIRMDVIHTAVKVSDLERTREFYEDGLGLDYSRDFVGDDGVTNYFVRGESEVEIQFKHDPDDDGAVDAGDFDHFAIMVEDTDEMVDLVVEETDGSLRAGPMEQGDVRIAFVEDPDGYGIEFIAPIE